MAPSNSNLPLARSLADALRDIEPRSSEHATDPLVDRLATALALTRPGAPEAADFDDDEDDALDLPMLVQGGTRVGAAVPLPTIERRGREGRAALIGFGLGMILLVPLGVVMSNRLPEPATVMADSSASSLLQAVLPATVITDEAGIRTTRRSTQSFALSPEAPSAAPAEASAERAPAAVETAAEVKTAAVLPPPLPAPAPPAAAIPAPDHLADAATLIGQGDISAARLRIEAADPDHDPLALMALAETFDPNMLAAWSIRGGHADADRARLLYQRALKQGVSKARQRLDALE